MARPKKKVAKVAKAAKRTRRSKSPRVKKAKALHIEARIDFIDDKLNWVIEALEYLMKTHKNDEEFDEQTDRIFDDIESVRVMQDNFNSRLAWMEHAVKNMLGIQNQPEWPKTKVVETDGTELL